MITVNSILTKALIVLQDAGATRWTDTEQVEWLNDGLRELITIHPDAKVKRKVVNLEAGAKQKMPTDAVLLIGIESVGGTVVTPCARAVLDAFSPNWMSKPAKTVTHFLYSPTEPLVYFIYPAQVDTSIAVELTYSAYPEQAVIGGNIDVLDKYANALLDYVLFRAYSKDAEFAGAAQIAAAYYQSFSK